MAICGCLISTATAQPPVEMIDLDTLGISAERLELIDDVVEEGMRRGRMPGCVVLVGFRDNTVFRKAYGHRQVVPAKQPMQVDTVFDLASLTKPIATATSIMILIEQGKVDPQKTIATYIPEFASNGKGKITVAQLLTHTGGLIPDNSIKDYRDGPEEAFRKIYDLKPYVPRGSKFVYTDVGFIVLAQIVQKVSGLNVHQFSQKYIFEPLGMKETGFLPAPSLQERCAVTEKRDDQWIRGQVHDPRAFALGGIAGHAGLFSTADDLAIYCHMMVNQGTWDGHQIMKPETIDAMTGPVPVSAGLRTFGWDMRSTYSSNRGDLFSKSAFGHGGFTGTAMWIDPEQELFVIFLSNRVHPDGKGSVNALAGRIATIAGAAVHP